jgi:hypothetical protein
MKRELFFILLFLFAEQTGIPNAFSQGGSFMDLNVYRWKNRLLLVFSSSPEDSNYQSFTKASQDHRNGLKDRDILLFEVFEKGQSRLGGSPLKKDSADLLRKQFGIPPGQFFIVLVGKDGEEKRRWQSMVGFDVIFSVIDAMPMRQREMKEGGKK